ncbi:FtsB family cell division protein [Lentilactobacillus sp. SPB1-3]|uniref:Septum formation initiator family protein n=1 Tax=Lentilactobacillus terminaliae TaxID=3003483 RepID=A0ACD5DGJ3_9LACO|nr:septum formation initiator family protein [Lentilactobacillus sp. SPB1-3]MCZ0977908.1 septum formation initiator family protein [Lentilactobacillus sp. SPB1-3]
MAKAKGKISKLENEFTKQRDIEMLQKKISNKLTRTRKGRALGIMAAFLCLILLLGFQIVSAKSNAAQINTQIAKQKANLNDEKSKNKQLGMKIKQLNNNTYVEKLIRERYYYTKPGETVYSFPDKAIDDLD